MGKVNEILNTDFSKLPKAVDLYKEFVKKSNIEQCGEEEFVLRKILDGCSKKQIIDGLRVKHPKKKFTVVDFDRFVERNKELMATLTKDQSVTAKRHLSARAHVEEKLAGIIIFTENLIKEYHADGDASSTLSALQVLNKSLMNYSKLSGFLEQKTDNRDENKVIDVVTNTHERLTEKIHYADFKMSEDEEDEDEDEKDK